MQLYVLKMTNRFFRVIVLCVAIVQFRVTGTEQLTTQSSVINGVRFNLVENRLVYQTSHPIVYHLEWKDPALLLKPPSLANSTSNATDSNDTRIGNFTLQALVSRANLIARSEERR